MTGIIRSFYLLAFGLLAPISKAEFIRLVSNDGDWRFVNSEGRFISLGINGIRMNEYWPADRDNISRQAGGFYDVRAKYLPPYTDWSEEVHERMTTSGFNTAGAWSSEILVRNGVIYTHALKMAWSRPGQHRLVDLFDPEYERYAREIAETACTSRASHNNLLGYFLDNELPWYGEKGWRTDGSSLLERYSQLDPSSPGRRRLLLFLQNSFTDWNEFRSHFTTSAESWQELTRSGEIKAWSALSQSIEDEWGGVVADRFFSVSTAAIKAADPNHLILGCRFVANAPLAVWQAAARYCDAVSVNYYSRTTEGAIGRWRFLYDEIQKPILISETSKRANENRSGNRNQKGADCTVATQSERADHVKKLLSKWLAEPHIVGVHWFEYADQPPAGRYNGEDSNFGLYDIHDIPYEETLKAWKSASEEIPSQRRREPIHQQISSAASAVPHQKIDGAEQPVLLWSPGLSSGLHASWDKNGGRSVLKEHEEALIWTIDTGTSWRPILTLKGSAQGGPLSSSGLVQINVSSNRQVSFKLKLSITGTAGSQPPMDAFIYTTPELRAGPNIKPIIIPISAFRLQSSKDPIRLDRHQSFTIESMGISPDINQGNIVLTVSEIAWLNSRNVLLADIYQAPHYKSKNE